MNVITDVKQVTCDWLSDVLRREGVLARGAVKGVTSETVLVYNSEICRLSLRYSNSAPAMAPKTVILKMKDGGGAKDELMFHEALGEDRAKLPMLLGWYDAAYSPELDAGHFLMRDLSATHAQTVSRSDE